MRNLRPDGPVERRKVDITCRISVNGHPVWAEDPGELALEMPFDPVN